MYKLLLAGLMAFGLVANVQAGDLSENDTGVRNLHQKNFTGQRPYSKAPQIKQQSPAEQWEGAGIVTDKPEKGFDKHQQMRLNFMGKRPYVGPPSD
ncbi:hypothetical protein [Methylophilus aquaticus]|uniref:Uncharacterized protein n=1 Tax=Methylophilus aquaticus TaxID=1971610 RepID=A0ABT9JPC3_9PROT|nr:hypothetical protein [Methylophilus aquaticus]MDP8566349.1 hypothetical protein [Methylophilus aquaticus]